MNRFSYFIVLFFLSLSSVALGQSCNIGNSVGTQFMSRSGNTQEGGQSFTACQTGTITRIRINILQARSNVTLRLQDGFGTFNPAYTQSGITLGAGDTDVILTTPYPVTAGNVYSFSFAINSNTNSIIHRYNGANPYPDGTVFNDFATTAFQNAGRDFVFEVEIAPAPTAVPTLSQWGLILLTLVVTCMGTIVLWKGKAGFRQDSV